jgi:NADPH2:quinone reductase
VAEPDLSAGMVRVRIQVAAVGFVDGLKVQGLYQTKDPLPFTPGSEFAGVVDEAVADVRTSRPAHRLSGWSEMVA